MKSSNHTNEKTVTRSTFIVTIIVLIVVIIGTGVYGASAISNDQSKISSLRSDVTTQQSQLAAQQTEVSSAPFALAMSHWNNIAIENATLITSEYETNAQLFWEGGPLTGNYTGSSAINSTWTKFAHAYEYVTWYSTSPPKVSLNKTSAVVQAQIQFVVFPYPTSSTPSPKSIVLNVTESLTFTYNSTSASWALNSEVWKVTPLQISDVAPGYSAANYTG